MQVQSLGREDPLEEGVATHSSPLQYSCLENPTDRGAWRAAVHRVAKSWTWLKQLSMHTPLFLQCSLVLCDIFCRECVGGNLIHRDMSNGECQQTDSSCLTWYTKLMVPLIPLLNLGLLWRHGARFIILSILDLPDLSNMQGLSLVVPPMFCLELFTKRPINILWADSWDWKLSSIHFLSFSQNGGWKQEGQLSTKWKAEPIAIFEHLKYMFCLIWSEHNEAGSLVSGSSLGLFYSLHSLSQGHKWNPFSPNDHNDFPRSCYCYFGTFIAFTCTNGWVWIC